MTEKTFTSDDVWRAIEEIAATSSKNAKETLVKQFAAEELFRRVLSYAYNPFKTYGVIPPRPSPSTGGPVFDDRTWTMLDDLVTRKLSGNQARDAVEAEFARLSGQSADLLWRIIKKDLRAGFSESTINKAVKGLIPDFPYMRCCLPKDTKLSAFDWETGVFSQEKADGMFANVDHEADGLVRLTSRQGSPFPIEQFAPLADEVRKRLAPGTQNHGELLVLRDGQVLPREIGNGVLNSVLKGGSFAANEQPIYLAWDQIPLSAVVTKGKYVVPYKTRFDSLAGQLSESDIIRIIPTRVVHSLDDAYTHYRELLAAGKEGTVIKTPNAIWKDGTSKEQVKLKLEFEVDLEIAGFVAGSGKNESTFGSITCVTSDRLLQVDVSGFSDARRKELSESRDEVTGKIMTVRANDIMPPTPGNDRYSLFLPRFVEIREDKSEADSLQRVKDQKNSAIKQEAA